MQSEKFKGGLADLIVQLQMAEAPSSDDTERQPMSTTTDVREGNPAKAPGGQDEEDVIFLREM